MGFVFQSGLSLESQLSHQTLSCSVVVLRHTRISQNDTFLAAVISLLVLTVQLEEKQSS